MKKLFFAFMAVVSIALAGCKDTNQPSGLHVDPELITCPAAGGDYTISVSSPNGAWSASSSESWIRVSPESGEKGSAEMRIKISANKEAAESQGKVTFVCGEEKVELPISRAAKDAPYLRIVSELSYNTPKEGGSYTVQVESNIKWSASSNASWAKVSKGVSVNNDNITITVSPATMPEETNATITIKPYGEGEEAGEHTVVITRGSTDATSLTVDPVEIKAPENGGNYTINVSSNAQWRVYKTWDMDWVTFLGSTEGNESGSFSISIEAATSTDALSGVITIEEVRSDNYPAVQVQVAIAREGKAAASLSVTPTTINAPAEGGTFPVEIESNYPWTASLVGTKIFSVSTTSGDGNATMNITVKPATEETEATGSITIKSSFGNEQARINIRRAGKPAPALNFVTWDDTIYLPYEGTKTLLPIQSNTSWRVHSTDTNVIKISPLTGQGSAMLNITVTPAWDTIPATVRLILESTDGNGLTDTMTYIRRGLFTIPYYQSRAFTVDGNGKHVYFAPGNLQYNLFANPSYRFADYQFHYVGNDTVGNVYDKYGRKSNNEMISDDYNGWIDLFGWGTGDCPADWNRSDYNSFVDWGGYSISYYDKNYNANLWRTMTKEEWEYLLEQRPNCTSLRGQATVYNVCGCVLLPDDWTCPAGLSFTPDPGNWTTNVYTFDQWLQMEYAGAVFLPAAGYRIGKYYLLSSNLAINGVEGAYWSASTISFYAAGFSFTGEYYFPRTLSRQYNGNSVRLVRDR